MSSQTANFNTEPKPKSVVLFAQSVKQAGDDSDCTLMTFTEATTN